MNREDIIAMAREAGWSDFAIGVRQEEIERFAALVASAERERIKQANAPEIERINAHIKQLEDAVKAEREACAKVCEGINSAEDYYGERPELVCAEAIRARGQ